MIDASLVVGLIALASLAGAFFIAVFLETL